MTASDLSNPVANGERRLAKRLTFSYIGALSLIAILSGGVHILLDNVIGQQRDAATEINVAGRQRMLSQRIGLLATDLKAGDAAARQPLLDAIALMIRSQDALIHGGDLGISHPLLGPMRRFYFEGPTPLDPAVRAFTDAARRFVQPGPDENATDAYHQMEASAHDELLPALDQAVSLFEGEANERVDWLRTAQQIVLAILLITLVMEALFIFRPLVETVRRYASHLYELATRDGLTGLANRRSFLEGAERALQVARRSDQALSAMMLDIDHFKQVNDTYGHAAGDAVLRRFGEIALAALRGSDLLGRLGGEEFGMVLTTTELDGALVVAEKLRLAIADDRPEGSPPITVSIGIGLLGPTDSGAEDLLKRADEALYEAKRQGRNRIVAQSL